MRPTRIYFNVLNKIKSKFTIKGIAHVTGGGLVNNIPRMVPRNLGIELIKDSWPIPKLFDLIQESSKLSSREMFSIFNMGIGLVLCIDQKKLPILKKSFSLIREKCYLIGKINNEPGLKII